MTDSASSHIRGSPDPGIRPAYLPVLLVSLLVALAASCSGQGNLGGESIGLDVSAVIESDSEDTNGVRESPGENISIVGESPSGDDGGGEEPGEDTNGVRESPGENVSIAGESPSGDDGGGEEPGEDTNGVRESPGENVSIVGESPSGDDGGGEEPGEDTNSGEEPGNNANTVVMFPQHDAPLRTDRGGQNGVAKLVLDGGCLRADYPTLDVDPSSGHRISISALLVWPETFTLSTEDGVVRVVDAYGRIAARVGDHVRITYLSVSFQEARDHGLIHGLSEDCPGPYWLAGDEVAAISLDAPSILLLSDPELHFPLQGTVLGEHEYLGAEAIGELVLDGHCLRLKIADRPSRLIFWPSGFTPHVYRGVVHVRNGAGRIIAQVGDEIAMGGAAAYYGYYYTDKTIGPKCGGPTWAPNGITVLPDVEVYFPTQDGTLGTDEETDRFEGKLILDRKCLVVDSVIRDRDRALFPSVRPLLIWPKTFTLSVDGEVVKIVDATGRVVARVGADVQFSAVSISYQEALEHSGLEEISSACWGPYWAVGDDFTAVPEPESP